MESAAAAANVDTSKFVAPDQMKDYKLDVEGRGTRDHILLKMLEGGLHADVTLKAQGGSVKAHRSVLACRSPVFSAIFQHEMKEQRFYTVDIPDMTFDGLQLFLLVLYTANEMCNNCSLCTIKLRRKVLPMTDLFTAAIDRHFGEFWQASHKYLKDNRSLRPVLKSALVRNLTSENCWHYFDSSLQVDGNNHDFSGDCHKYILDNYDKVISSDSLLVEMRHNPELLHRILIEAAERNAATLDHFRDRQSQRRQCRLLRG